MSVVVGIDLGGTRLRTAVVDSDTPLERVVASSVARAPSSLDELVAAARRAIDDAPGAAIDSLGITVPGLVVGTRCRWVPNLPFLDGVDLAGIGLDVPTIVAGNDAQLALLAEVVGGAAQGVDDAFLVAVGTGIGSAVLAAGRVVVGAHGGACSFGWATLDPSAAGDERSGWLERHAGGAAFDAIAREQGYPDTSEWFAAARAGDQGASAAIADAATALGAAVATVVATIDPAVVLLAGGVAEAFEQFEQPLRASLRRHLPPHLRDVDVRPGAHGSAAGLRGAVAAARLGAGWAVAARSGRRKVPPR